MKIHKHGEKQIRILYEQIPNYEIHLTEEEVQGISTNTLIFIGDNDKYFNINTIVTLHNLLPNSYLWVLPNTGHGAHLGKNKPEFIRIANEFFQDKWVK